MTRKGNRGATKNPAIIFTGIKMLDQVRSTMAFFIRVLAPKERGKLKRSKMCLHLDYVSICSLVESIDVISYLFTGPFHLLGFSMFS